jgi:chromosome segregation ATPase
VHVVSSHPRLLLLAVALLAVVDAHAQTARSGGGPNVQLLQQMEELASERTSLQAENQRLKGELADVKKERDSLKAGQQTLAHQARESAAALAQSASQRASSEQELTQLKAKMQDLIAKFRETIQTLREAESQGAAAQQTLATREHELAACKTRNAALYTLDGDVLTHFEKQGAWACVARAEPFTRIKRTQLENYVDEQRTRANEQHIAPPPATPDRSNTSH